MKLKLYEVLILERNIGKLRKKQTCQYFERATVLRNLPETAQNRD